MAQPHDQVGLQHSAAVDEVLTSGCRRGQSRWWGGRSRVERRPGSWRRVRSSARSGSGMSRAPFGMRARTLSSDRAALPRAVGSTACSQVRSGTVDSRSSGHGSGHDSAGGGDDWRASAAQDHCLRGLLKVAALPRWAATPPEGTLGGSRRSLGRSSRHALWPSTRPQSEARRNEHVCRPTRVPARRKPSPAGGP
jgi:hypothetical protein